MDNQRIAQVFQEIGDILEIQDANRFRVLAYHRAAQTISEMGEEVKDIYSKDPKKLEGIPGVGKDLAAKIVELITTGKCKYHQELIDRFDKGLLDILRVRGIGPKKVKLFYAELGVNSIEKLREAAEKGKLRELPRMGEKSEHEILVALGEYEKHSERMLLSEALHYAKDIIDYMKKSCRDMKKIEYAGSLRRMKETIGDIDILVVSTKPKKVMECFAKYPHCENVIAQGPTKTSIILDVGVQVDLRVLEEKSFGAAWHYFTGSKDHNVALRDYAKKRGMKVNEYGVFKLVKKRGQKEPEEKYLAGKTEEEVYKIFKMSMIPPEIRENRGEIEAALRGRLPKLVEHKDLRGDLHVHSKWSDGVDEIEKIARSYRDEGFEYMALTDHSPAVAVAHGLTPERFKLQWAEIDEINADFEKEHKKGGAGLAKKPAFKILKGTECDILPDGSLDLPDKILKKMDIVVASVHSRFKMSEKEMTARVLKAFKNPYVTQFGHPTGRLLNRREPYAIDMARVIDACAHLGIALEIDGQPERLDLFDYYAKIAKDKGAKFTLDSDAHSIAQMQFLHYAVAVARRGWLEKDDVLNTLPLSKLLKFVHQRRK